MSILRWLKKETVAGLPDPDKEQSLLMQSVVAAANDAVRPVQSVVSKNTATMHHMISAFRPVHSVLQGSSLKYCILFQ